MKKKKIIVAAFMTTVFVWSSAFGCSDFFCPECDRNLRACNCFENQESKKPKINKKEIRKEINFLSLKVVKSSEYKSQE